MAKLEELLYWYLIVKIKIDFIFHFLVFSSYFFYFGQNKKK